MAETERHVKNDNRATLDTKSLNTSIEIDNHYSCLRSDEEASNIENCPGIACERPATYSPTWITTL